MTKEGLVAYWLDLVAYDIETAEAMYDTRRWLYVAFMCHQAIEKALKAHWCATQPTPPPYIHSHRRLADGCGLYDSLTAEQKDFLDTIATFNIEAWYPERKEALLRMLTPSACKDIIDKTKEFVRWIQTKP